MSSTICDGDSDIKPIGSEKSRLNLSQEQNWYMPQPGVPYRPIVAVPRKINNLNPFFAICEDVFFTALDPPRALVTAPNLVLKPTIAHLQASTTPPMPNRIPKTDPEDNGSARPTTSVPRPAQIPKPPEPQQTSDPKDQGHASSGNAEQDSENTQGKTLAIGNNNPVEAVTVNGQVAQPLSDDAISIAGTTLTPGASPITISGIEISLGQSKIAVGNNSVPIATAADSVWIPGRVTTIDSQPIQPISGNEVSIAGVALSKGASALTISGTLISLGSNALYIGTNSIPLRTQLAQQSVITVDGRIFTAAPTGFSIAGTSLAPSHAVTIAGTTVSLDASSNLHIGSSTIYLGDNAADISLQVFTVAGQVFTANPIAVDVAGVTLAPERNGITVSGRNVSLDSAGDLVVDSSIDSIKISTGSLGGLIMGEFNSTRASGPSSIRSESGVQTFRGRAETLQVSLSAKLVILLIFVASIFAGL